MVRTATTEKTCVCAECGHVSVSPTDSEIHVVVMHPYTSDGSTPGAEPSWRPPSPPAGYPPLLARRRLRRWPALVTVLLVGVVAAIVTNLKGANGHRPAAGSRAPLTPVEAGAPSPPPPTTVSPAAPLAGTAWSEVVNAEDGYSLELPPGWTAASLRQVPVEMAVGTSAGVAAMVPAAVLRQMDASGSLFAFPSGHHGQFLAVSVAPAGGSGIDGLSVTVPAELASRGAVSISEDLGHLIAGPALRVAYQMPAPAGSISQLSFLVISNGRLYTLTFGTLSPARDSGLFYSIAATLRPS